MDKKDFLFELGVEEIPVAYTDVAIKTIKDHFETNLKKANLEYNELQVFSTPRRFTIKITSLQTQQKDEVIERTGPTKEIAYDVNNNLTKAALGFLRGAGAEEKDIIIKHTSKGDKIAIKKEIKGKPAEDILQQIILEVIPKINFPKSMRWGNGQLVFARPIRWLLALFGKDVLPLSFNGLQSGRVSYGNRFQKLDNPIEINLIDEYEEKLAEFFVIPNREKRKEIIYKQMNLLFMNSGEKITENNRLLDIVTDLVEYPTAVIAEFDEKYLELPELVVTSTLSEHQKYFSVSKSNGKISNKFLFISNGDPQYSNLIKKGNEKVITARLEDAEFFYKEDLKKHFSKFVPSLSRKPQSTPYNQKAAISKLNDIMPDKVDLTTLNEQNDIVSFLKFITFQGDLGTLYDKTNRIMKLVDYICRELKFSKEICQDTNVAAYNCKADLSTMMLGEKEYTKLQGYIGHHYALKSGIKKNIALAIEEHYFPRSEKDNLPTAIEGSIVAIADKMDTVCGIIGVDMIPTGSKDPFALRRAGNGVVQIIANQDFEIDLYKLIDVTFDFLESKLKRPENNKDVVYDFFKQRVNWLLKQKQFDYDIIDSVMHIDHSNIPDLIIRAEALQELKKQEDFIKLVLGFKRVSNIIAKVKATSNVKTEILKDMELTLYSEYEDLEKKIKELLPDKNYKKILDEFVEYGSTIDNFFDEVLVNVEDLEIKQNRYNILFCIRELFLQVADLSKLVVEGEK